MKKYALVVGIGVYDDPEITNLSFAAQDAQDMAACLRHVCGFEDVRLLVSDGDLEPDHVNIVDALHNIAPLTSKDDLFLLYFAGHGIQTRAGTYLLASNSRIRMPELASLSMNLLTDCLGYIEAASRVLILDACRNDPHQGMGDADNLLTREFSRDIIALAKTPVAEVVPATCVLFSCSEGERAWEWPDQRHGAFTHYLLEGIRGAAFDTQRRLTIQSLGQYVEEQVRRWSHKTGKPRPQTPWAQQLGSLRPIVLTDTAPSTQTDKPAPPGEAYIEAAEQGHAWAQTNLGDCYYHGRGVDQDYQEAVRWYRKAAEQGHAWAQTNLGDCYYHGRGVNQDCQEAVKWYRKAAEQGHAWAQTNLGDCYYHGRGVDQDYQEAVKWYREAAEQGHAWAQTNLGDCYRRGHGVVQDCQEADKWYRKAVD